MKNIMDLEISYRFSINVLASSKEEQIILNYLIYSYI